MIGIKVEFEKNEREERFIIMSVKNKGAGLRVCSRDNGQLALTRASSHHDRLRTHNTNTTQPYFAARGTTVETNIG